MKTVWIAVLAWAMEGTPLWGQLVSMCPDSCDSAPHERTYTEKTITIRMVPDHNGLGDFTALYITEKGDADFVWGEAFYYTVVNGERLMLHKEFSTPVTKLDTWAADVQLPVDQIVFLRVRELHLLRETEMGERP